MNPDSKSDGKVKVGGRSRSVAKTACGGGEIGGGEMEPVRWKQPISDVVEISIILWSSMSGGSVETLASSCVTSALVGRVTSIVFSSTITALSICGFADVAGCGTTVHIAYRERARKTGPK